MLVQTQIGHQPLELRVLLAELAQLADIGDTHPGILLLPVVEGGFAHPHLAARCGDRFGSTLDLLQHIDNLFGCISALLHFLGSVRLLLTENPQVPNRPIFREDVNGGLEASELKRIKELEAENARLKKMYAEMAMFNEALKELIEKSSDAGRAARSRWLADRGKAATREALLQGDEDQPRHWVSSHFRPARPGSAHHRPAQQSGHPARPVGVLKMLSLVAAARRNVEPQAGSPCLPIHENQPPASRPQAVARSVPAAHPWARFGSTSGTPAIRTKGRLPPSAYAIGYSVLSSDPAATGGRFGSGYATHRPKGLFLRLRAA